MKTFTNMLKRESHLASIDLMSSDRNLSGLTTSLAAEVALANVRNMMATETIQMYYMELEKHHNDWIDSVDAAASEIQNAFETISKKYKKKDKE